MAKVKCFTFNPFQENTYLVIDPTGDCVIFDPGCNNATEKQVLADFIRDENLKPVRLINTHCHLDHVFGNKFVAEQYQLPLEIHKDELPILEAVPQISQMYGMPVPESSPAPGRFLVDGETIAFGETKLVTILTPGHSPGELCFYCEADRFIIAGDVLFDNSIGRTDLPGGDYTTLIRSIKEKLLPLGDDYVVYPGHGPATTIEKERLTNPFLTDQIAM